MIAIKKNQQGFTVEIVVVAAVVVVMIALGAYSYAHRPKAAVTSSAPAAPRSSSRPSNSGTVSGPWRDPNIAKEIAAAGQTVVSQKQVDVSAQADWVDSGLQVAAGQHLWVDTKAAGKWSGNPDLFPYSDANGLAAYPGGYRIDAKANVLSLIGFVGSSLPQVGEQDIAIGAPAGGAGGITDPGLFEPGNTLKNFAPATSGEVWLRNNDNTNFFSDQGRQTAQVWITASR